MRTTLVALVLILAACDVAPTPTRAPIPKPPTAAPTAAASPTPGTQAAADKPALTEAPKPTEAKPEAPKPTQVAVQQPAPPPVHLQTGPPSAPQPKLPDIAGVADKVRPAVAFIAVQAAPIRGMAGVQPRAGVGSGAIFDQRGYIITNNHVVEGGQQIKVVLPDSRSFDAKIVGRDPPSDIAVLKIEGANLPIAALGDSDKLKVGDWVVAIGNALGLEGGPTVTAGVVSAVGRAVDLPGGTGSIESAIQTDTAINPGNSGGPLINLQGEVVGINTLVAGQISPDLQAQGIGFAISINNVRPIVDELIAKGRVERPWLGVSVVPLTPAIAQQIGVPFVEGLVVAEAVARSPAYQAGLRQGDILTAMDGVAMKSVAAMRDVLGKKKVGDKVELTWRREGQERKATATLANRPVA